MIQDDFGDQYNWFLFLVFFIIKFRPQADNIIILSNVFCFVLGAALQQMYKSENVF